ncbi:MAG: MFS transporter [Pseudolabrys sp.]|jgi:FSR family fosmidomycin resistance protein-like MFS transporter
MVQASGVRGAGRATDARLIGVVSAAHFVSHYYIILLAPLFAFVRADYNVSYTELGLALTAFNVVSATLQTPAGFLVDRLGPRLLLIGGLLLGAGAFAVAGLVDSFWVLVAMFGVAGLANTVYHPGDYALLSHHVAPNRISQAFSIHTFAGMLGSAVAPGTLLLMQSQWGWRGAFLGAAALGFAAAILLAFHRENEIDRAQTKSRQAGTEKPAGWQLLLSAPIMLNLVFFLLFSVSVSGVYNYSVVALNALYATPVTIANAALSAFLLLSSLGVLVGGFIAARTSRHSVVAVLGVIILVAAVMLVGNVDLGSVLLILVMSIGGFFTGVVMPSRDMIVRDITPPGSFGTVFGFVTTGFNIGGVVSPLIFGAIMDHGNPRMVFIVAGVVGLMAIVTVLTLPAPRAQNN